MFSALARRSLISNPRLKNPRVPSRRLLTTPPPPPSRGSGNGRLLTISAVAAASLGAYTLGSVYPPTVVTLLFPRVAPPPLNAGSLEAAKYAEDLEQSLKTIPLLETLRTQPDADEWYETRAYQNYPEERRVNNLSAGALRGPGKLAVAPIVRARKDEKEAIMVVHVGRGLCGHDGIVHGGLLATLLDESLARTAIANLPEKVGVTAQLTLNYRAPTRADQFIIIRTSVTELQGRKAKVTGRVEDLDGNVLVEANALFIQPKYAKLLDTAGVKQMMGEPPEEPVLLADGKNVRPTKRT